MYLKVDAISVFFKKVNGDEWSTMAGIILSLNVDGICHGR
jgi:hypothetical protein